MPDEDLDLEFAYTRWEGSCKVKGDGKRAAQWLGPADAKATGYDTPVQEAL